MKKISEKPFLTALVLSMAFSIASAEDQKEHDETGKNALIQDLDCVIQPSEIVDIGSPVSGVIAKINADRSDVISKDELLVKLKSDVQLASLRIATSRARQTSGVQLRQASLQMGYKALERSKNLLKNAAISEQDMDQITTDIRIAELNLRQEEDQKLISGLEREQAAAILEQRSIKSPINGVVVDRYKSVGERIDDDPILRIAQVDPLHVEVVIPAKYYGQVKSDMLANVRPVVGSDETYQASVERIDQVIDASSSTFRVILNLPNPDNTIAPGLRCNIDILTSEQSALLQEYPSTGNI